MKKSLLCSVFFAVIATPAFAAHHLVEITSVIRVSAAECAIELAITGDDQNAFVDEDNIAVGGVVLVDFQDLVAAGINDSAGNNDSGDVVLAASESFADEFSEIDPDLVFEDAGCESFTSTATFSFNINGDSTVDEIDATDINGFGEDATAIVLSGGDYELADLTEDELAIANNTGDTATIGSLTVDSDAADTASVSCALVTSGPTVQTTFMALALLGVGVLLFVRFQDPNS